MQVVLTGDVSNLGKKGEVVSVKEGYWRNYLLPNELALLVDEDRAKQLTQAAREAGEKEQIEVHELEKRAEKILDQELVVKVKVGEKGQLFSAVNETRIKEEILKLPLVYPELITPLWVYDRLNDWGEDSPIFQSRVLAIFPEE